MHAVGITGLDGRRVARNAPAPVPPCLKGQDFALIRALKAEWSRWQAHQRNRQDMRTLTRLDDRLLADIGLTRTHVIYALGLEGRRRGSGEA
jgi:uncharacterized protein YjiS (DUF1127 family)